MTKRGRGDEKIGLRKGVAPFAAFLQNEPPSQNHLLAQGQDAALKHWSHSIGEPITQRRPSLNIGQPLDAEADFSDADNADVNLVKRQATDKGGDFWVRLWAAKFRENVGVEQPIRQRSTSRKGKGPRSGSSSTSRNGEACNAAMSAAPVRSPFRRRNSSTEMTTTSSRPWIVTCCGPSLRTRRTSSLNRAFASWSGHRPCRERLRSPPCGGKADLSILVMPTRITQAPCHTQAG